jgi:hypothetical protein
VAALFATLTLAIPHLATAQTTPATVSTQSEFLNSAAFKQLVDGKQVLVRTTDGRVFEEVFALSSNALVASGFTTIPFDQISSVSKASFRIRHHTFIGLGIGAVVGGVLACRDGFCSDGPYWLLGAMFGGGIGAGIGAGVGGILNRINRDNDLIYDANRRTTTMALAPILSPTRKGFAFSMTWR